MHAKIEFIGQSFQKLDHKEDRQTDAIECITTAAFGVVMNTDGEVVSEPLMCTVWLRPSLFVPKCTTT